MGRWPAYQTTQMSTKVLGRCFALCPSTIYGRNLMGKRRILKEKSRSLANACCIWRLHTRIAASTLSRCSRGNERDVIHFFEMHDKRHRCLRGGLFLSHLSRALTYHVAS